MFNKQNDMLRVMEERDEEINELIMGNINNYKSLLL